MKTMSMQRNILLFSFLFIPVVLLLMFVLYPLTELMRLSFTDWNGVDAQQTYTGFDNYIKMFTDSSDVWLSLRNNGIYFIFHLIMIPLELMIAVLLDSKIRASKFFKTFIFMPYIINGVAISYMFAFFYSPINGGLNGILEVFGMETLIRNWLTDESIVNLSLVFVSIWRFSGFHIILFLAGLQSIPQDQFEAAKIDGANNIQNFWYIIVPGVKKVLEVILFLNVVGALQVFDIPYIMTQGGPGHASSTFTLYTLETAFKFNSFGMASAMGVTMLILIIVLNGVQNKVFNLKGVDEE
ncbi:carbohydrate ABC transporter permease [Paenibacillus sp. DMB20]|uniref:carbohydrate ABC transporter permease n=1 Tax=Paenibacillus sp. DMB20 TaxID=1642570 RepID=UPI0006280456|nr:sugar ABC transporter permease [Paenibacillus sp. DMB20]KKO53476.1 sugar ABC transporter permease [Paenibacillus sp. DMB20]